MPRSAGSTSWSAAPRQTTQAARSSKRRSRIGSGCIAINLTGSFLLSRAVLPYMIEGGGGSIIFIASQMGRVGGAGRPAYCATKGALIQLAKVMAVDHAAQNIRVNTLSPGAVETQRMLYRYGSFEAAQKRMDRSICRGASASRTRSPPPRYSSPATRPASSPAATSWSTAATPRSDACSPCGEGAEGAAEDPGEGCGRRKTRLSACAYASRSPSRSHLVAKVRRKRPLTLSRMNGLSLYDLQHGAVGGERRQERAAAAGAGIERDREIALHEPRCCRSKPRTTRRKPSNGAVEIENVASRPTRTRRPAPPAGGGDRPRHGQTAAAPSSVSAAWRRPASSVVCPGAAFIASRSVGGPAGDRQRPVARRGKAVPQLAAIGAQRRFDALAHHPGQHLAGIAGELQLQQLLPHLLLGAAQIHDIAGKAAPARHDAPAEVEQFVDRGGDRAAVSEIIAEIDDTVAVAEALRDPVMQPGEPLGLAMDRGNRPDAPGAPLSRARFRIARGRSHPALRRGLLRLAPPVRPTAAARPAASRSISSIRSTAANSRTSRSSAAW